MTTGALRSTRHHVSFRDVVCFGRLVCLRLRDGFQSQPAHKRYFDVDAFDQNAAAAAVLYPMTFLTKTSWDLRHAFLGHLGAVPDQLADRDLDALHLLQGNPERDHRSGKMDGVTHGAKSRTFLSHWLGAASHQPHF